MSEADKGIYDAMNKGIDVARGDWLNFMNAGDTFVNNDILSKITFEQHRESVLLYGTKMQNGKTMPPMKIDVLKFGEIMACHQSMFFNKRLLQNNLTYNLDYPIYADYDLVNRIYMLNEAGIRYIDIAIVCFLGGGISSQVSIQKRKDKYLILLRSYGMQGVVKGILYRLYRVFK